MLSVCEAEKNRRADFEERISELEFDLQNEWKYGHGPDDLFIEEDDHYAYNWEKYGNIETYS